MAKSLYPILNIFRENTPDEGIQEKIELLIHRLHYQDLQEEFSGFEKSKDHDLLTGALLVSRYPVSRSDK